MSRAPTPRSHPALGTNRAAEMNLCAHCPLAGGWPWPWRGRASLARSGNVSGLQILWAPMHPGQQHTGSEDSTGPPALDRQPLSPLAPTAGSPLATRSLSCGLICSQTTPPPEMPTSFRFSDLLSQKGLLLVSQPLARHQRSYFRKKSSYRSPTKPSRGCKASHGHGPELGEGQAVCRGHSW